MRIIRGFVLLNALIVFSLISGCKSPVKYENVTVFEDQIWNRFDIQEYTFMPEKSSSSWDVYFIFDHLDLYYTDHIAVNITFYLPQEGTRSRDYTFKLKNDQLEWTGQQINQIIQHQLPVIKGFTYEESGPLKVRVESKMTKFNLTAVQRIGILFTESEQ